MGRYNLGDHLPGSDARLAQLSEKSAIQLASVSLAFHARMPLRGNWSLQQAKADSWSLEMSASETGLGLDERPLESVTARTLHGRTFHHFSFHSEKGVPDE